MIHRPALDTHLKKIVFATLALMVGWQILVWRALFADGAFLLMRILSTRRFHDSNEPSRVFDYWFTQFPTVFAVKLGVTNLHFLTYLFCGWMILCFMLFWIAALWSLRRDILFWPFTALFIVAYFNGGFFTIGEYNLDYALTACCFALLLRQRENNAAAYALLMGAAFLSLFTYASTMFLGLVLAAVTFYRLWRETNPKLKIYWLLLAAIFLVSSGIGVWGYVYSIQPLNKARASSFGVLFYDYQYWLIVAFTVLAGAQLFIPSRSIRDALFLALMGIAVLLLTGLFLPHPTMDFAIRVCTGLALCAGFAAISWVRFGGFGKLLGAERLATFDPVKHCALPITTLLLVLAFFDLDRSKNFGPYLDRFRAEVNSHSGTVPWEATMATAPNDLIFGWSWTYPSMSLILRRDSHAAIIRNAERNTESQPFEPEHPPDLSRYYPND